MGELVWSLWPGPVDRWDRGNVTRIKLYDGALSSVAADDVFAGANTFAIEADGEWEVLQARQCVLVAPGEYELRDLLRGQLGTAHAMAAPHPVGARIVLLDQNLVRVSVGAHEWGEPLRFVVRPHNELATDARAATSEISLPHAALRPRATCISAGCGARGWVILGERASRRSARARNHTCSTSWTAAMLCEL
jgi:hypothetical protein